MSDDLNENDRSTLALFRALHAEFGAAATEITVRTVRVKLERAPVIPSFDTATSAELENLRAEVAELRLYRERMEG